MKRAQQIKKNSNTKLNHVWKRLVKAQERYYKKHGRYFQLLADPETKPEDGAEVDVSLRKARHEKNFADVSFSLGERVPFQLEVHEHVGKEGAGFTAYVRTRIGGREFMRSMSHGIGGQTTEDWVEVVDEAEEVAPPTSRPVSAKR